MNDIGWLFVYTPLPWLGIFYIAFFRHDLSRLAKPFRDSEGTTMWLSVCRYLDLIKADAPKPSRRAWKSKSFFALVIAATINFLRLVIFVPLAWYYVMLLQVASALVLFLVLVNRIGRLRQTIQRHSPVSTPRDEDKAPLESEGRENIHGFSS